MLDTMAQRYHLLPSEIMRRADTLDMYVLDVSMSWQRYQQECAQRREAGLPPPAPDLSINNMKEMIERARQQ